MSILVLTHVFPYSVIYIYQCLLLSQALAHIFGTEEFETRPGDFLKTDEDKVRLCAVTERVREEVVREDYDMRRLVRPLLDAAQRYGIEGEGKAGEGKK